jgi:hypothetical protein
MKTARDAAEHFDSTVDPWLAHTSAGGIDENTRFTVVERTDNDVCPSHPPKSDTGGDIIHQRSSIDRRIEFTSSPHGAVCFRFPDIGLAKKRRPCKVADFDPVHVGNRKMTNAEQRQVLDHFVSKRARAHDKHTRIAQKRLIPPLNAFKS